MSETSAGSIGKIGLQLAIVPWLGWVVCHLPGG